MLKLLDQLVCLLGLVQNGALIDSFAYGVIMVAWWGLALCLDPDSQQSHNGNISTFKWRRLRTNKIHSNY